MSFRRLWILVSLFLATNLLAQPNPTDLIEYTIIDSLPAATLGTGLRYWGFGDVHLATNGERIILAAKKTYKDPATNRAMTHLVYGERETFGRWQFKNVYDYMDSLFLAPVVPMLMHGALPIVFFADRELYKSFNLYFTNETGTGWVTTLLDLDPHNDSSIENDDIREDYGGKGFAVSQGNDGATAFWWRSNADEITPGNWQDKWQLVGKNWIGGESFTIWTSPYLEIVGGKPVTTEDGEYIAFSYHSKDASNNNYWGIRVYRRTDSGYVLDFADSTMKNLQGDFYNLAIGKKANGDVLLVAANASSYVSPNRPIWIKSNGSWSKVMDDFPAGSGLSSYLTSASSRGPFNERIQFSRDGTAFWGDLDGWITYTASAEVSFYTPDGRFGHVVFPDLPGYQWHGSFQHHDFCITDDDTLHIVYNYRPPVENAPMYLIEGKLYIPDLLAMTTGVDAQHGARQPAGFTLEQNYPNPFNPVTTIRFSLPRREHVSLKVFDLLGREKAALVDGNLNPGKHAVSFDAAGLPSGVYLYRLQVGNQLRQRKMILMK